MQTACDGQYGIQVFWILFRPLQVKNKKGKKGTPSVPRFGETSQLRLEEKMKDILLQFVGGIARLPVTLIRWELQGFHHILPTVAIVAIVGGLLYLRPWSWSGGQETTNGEVAESATATPTTPAASLQIRGVGEKFIMKKKGVQLWESAEEVGNPNTDALWTGKNAEFAIDLIDGETVKVCNSKFQELCFWMRSADVPRPDPAPTAVPTPASTPALPSQTTAENTAVVPIAMIAVAIIGFAALVAALILGKTRIRVRRFRLPRIPRLRLPRRLQLPKLHWPSLRRRTAVGQAPSPELDKQLGEIEADVLGPAAAPPPPPAAPAAATAPAAQAAEEESSFSSLALGEGRVVSLPKGGKRFDYKNPKRGKGGKN
ncbi:hypothetical protein A2773_02200 [Candidatus Gottesmanbacteria bacterium RIFCSPHIGHO2_01_FULL_39_10]|uniref:Uncharacterized protein n=1 Tax=Candidatus Gottesmanbacteria bacterium RIFCSPHIGHO2_01_FULL_39_10 TaxID=1798375 RepID=A0A1F5ZPZ3_9BACT|nr:MAG: hypothetical protein A2773_02200 [Candidatus Gottesmanbacteria bacterium RIFCSPHIGHO2_01_FULL_39_10]